MSEDSIKTAEEQLHALINESNLVLTKMKTDSNLIFTKLRRIINVLITVGLGIFITFLFSFVDVRSRMSTLESEKATKVELTESLDKYSLKTDVIFLQNNVYEINKAFYAPGKDYNETKMESRYSNALKQFNGDVSRGTK
jgi:hypothetical protein